MIEKDNIKDLFSKQLENHASSVRPEVWNGLQAKMAAAGVSSVAAAKGISVLTKWIIGGAAVTTTAVVTTVALLSNNELKPQQPAKEQPQQEVSAQAPVVADKTLVTVPESQPTAAPVERQQEFTAMNLWTNPPVARGTNNDLPAQATTGESLKPETPKTPGSEAGAPQKPAGQGTQNPPVQPAQPVKPGATETPADETPAKPAHTKSKIEIPNIFTPNGDGENDQYFIQSTGLQNCSITILDAQSRAVFKSDDPNFKWDGNGFDGTPVPNGNYTCIVIGEDASGNPVRDYGILRIQR